jgi:hypothetical protein
MQYRNSPRLLLDHTDGKPERSPRRRTKGAFDRDKLNVRWSVENDRTTFYDDALFPTRVIACDQTCEEIKASEDSSIDFLLGCATIVPG